MSSIINIHKALTQAKKDDRVGISIAPLSSGSDFCLFSAEIKKGNKVGCHYHTEGDEIYSVLSGEGIIYTGSIDDDGNVDDICFRPVVAGDSFTVSSRHGSSAESIIRYGFAVCMLTCSLKY